MAAWKGQSRTIKEVAGRFRYERDLHLVVAKLLTYGLADDVLWTTIEHAAKMTTYQSAERKARGVKRGIPDILLVLPGGQAAFIELKAQTGQLMPHQHVWKAHCERIGAHFALCRSLDDVCEALTCWGVRLKAHVR